MWEQMKKKIKGSVALLSSIYNVFAQNMSIYKNTKMSENMNYSIIKGRITNFARQLASYYGKNCIRINTVSRGGISGHIKCSNNKQSKNFIKNYSNNYTLQRLATAEEVAFAILFLDASFYITDTYLMVDGGWSAI